MKLVVAGAAGRMGRALIAAASEMDGVAVSGAFERKSSSAIGEDAGLLAGIGEIGVRIADDPESLVAQADAILDFTAPEASVRNAELAAEASVRHVIGTTGLSAKDESRIAAAARRTVIVKSGNMSLGVNLLASLVRDAARALDADWDIEILEMHHRHKVDAPSGTALLLGEAAAAGRRVTLSDAAIRARDGHTGARRRGAVGFQSLRGGSVVGEHLVVLAGEGERVTLGHIAESRTIFARGALKAALWARNQAPGLYSMADVLGLES